MIVKTCGNNARRQNYKGSVLRMSHKEKGPVESQEQDGWMRLKMM